jgi:hypothetical protein
MQVEEKIFRVNGDKINSLMLTPTSMLFSSAVLHTEVEFKNALDKKITLNTNIEIKFDSIKTLTKEENDDEIRIKYKGLIGLPSETEFSFKDQSDCNTFFTILEKEHFFTKDIISLSAVKANFRYFLGLLLTSLATVVAYVEAMDIKAGNHIDTGSAKNKLFNMIVSFLGDKGVLLIGIAIGGFILYKMYGRIKNPPMQIKFTKPNM